MKYQKLASKAINQLKTNNDIAIFRPRTRLEQQFCRRQSKVGKLIEPLSGYYAHPQRWEQLTQAQKMLTKIYAVARQHPDWSLTSISAALVLGATISHELSHNLHFAVDTRTNTRARKRLPFRFHYVKNSRPQRKIQKVLKRSTRRFRGIVTDTSVIARLYTPINESIGIMNGILVTSPLQTIFDCLRDLPFEQALVICDQLTSIFHLNLRAIRQAIRSRRHCWKVSTSRFSAQFVDGKSDNGGESFCRARMISAGFSVPKLQPEIRNPLSLLRQNHSVTLQRTETIRPDYVWKIPRIRSHNKQSRQAFTWIAAELDGKEKYLAPRMLESIGASNIQDVILREKDRETALALAGFKIVRFQFQEAAFNGGASMIAKLRLAGVPEVPLKEKRRRRKYLVHSFADSRLRRMD